MVDITLDRWQSLRKPNGRNIVRRVNKALFDMVVDKYEI